MKKAMRTMAVLLLAVLICTLMNVAACFVNSQRMGENAAQAVQMLMYQGSQPEAVGGFPSARLDNYTAVLMIKTAAYTGAEPLAMRALGGMRVDLPAQQGQDAWEAFCTLADGRESPTGGLSYSRYWHGYLLPLRLLLCMFNLPNIQMLLLFTQMVLFLFVMLRMVRRALTALLPGFVTAYFFMMPVATGICVQYVSVSLLTLMACAAILCFDAPIDRAIGLPGFFAFVGLLSNYFDLLTFPLVTLGFPLVLCICLSIKEDSSLLGKNAWQIAKRAVVCCVAWGAGYAGMWAAKWLLTAIFIGSEWIAGIFGQVRLRVSSTSNGGSFSRWDVVCMNMRVLTDKAAYLLIGALTAVLLLICVARKTWRESGMGCPVRADARAFALIVPAVLPVLWILVMSNHSFDHWYYTYRILSCTALALYALLAYVVQTGEKRMRREYEKNRADG